MEHKFTAADAVDYKGTAGGEKVTVTFLRNSMFPRSLRLPVPGTERMDENGNPEPGTGRTQAFYCGYTHLVDRAVADMVLKGPAGLLPVAVVDGVVMNQRAFVEGVPEEMRKQSPDYPAQEITQLKAMVANLATIAADRVDDPVKAAQLRQMAADMGGSEEAEEELPDGVDLPRPVTADDLDVDIQDGRTQVAPDGSLICSVCNEWTTKPPHDGYDMRKALEMHKRKAHKREPTDEGEGAEL